MVRPSTRPTRVTAAVAAVALAVVAGAAGAASAPRAAAAAAPAVPDAPAASTTPDAPAASTDLPVGPVPVPGLDDVLGGPLGDAVDRVLTATGAPGPHRVPGHYYTSPGVPREVAESPTPVVGPSTPLVVGRELCTATVAGFDAAGRRVAVTAGHCGTPGDPVTSADAPERGQVGVVARVGDLDQAVILLDPTVTVTATYGDVTVTGLGGPTPAPMTQVCKTGITTGRTCGPVLEATPDYITAHYCGSEGDSGAPVLDGGRLVGMVNGSSTLLPSCVTPLQGDMHSPTVGATWTAVAEDLDATGGVGAGFRLP
ncbi:hypothetical protein [Corynebacterium bovis]|uniref:Trypsin n=5 Tax=Corynebacterium bovis TaxID=36808 RepID=A0A8H9Y742_9CORY|nr:hypothetical protein [Corynebacterium bovis]MBB3115713.1 hypothetical protein [Corynebacterium bovis DSM 20582 = CIP 54.80]QQC47398.1 hypothetical protein I6I09_10465 [Corynebacterium bovis]WJY77137.1 hypothetical protein CBOVI_03000 [Corynebacterium bovis DSM 20582 = CIP 54.80]